MSELVRSKYNNRVLFPKGKQREFLEVAADRLNFSTDMMAKLAGVHPRSFRDWKREKLLMSQPAFIRLCKKANIQKPNVKIKEPFWYTSKGHRASWLVIREKYGGRVPVDEKYRKKMWYEWWEKIGKFKKNSITTVLPISIPNKSEELAEFIGIILGDGGITKRQVTITCHKIDDIKYAKYIKKLTKKLFGVNPTLFFSKKDNVVDIMVSRTKLVEFLKNNGLCVGSKVRQQVEVPTWIVESEKFSRSCLRGLFDTDGCFYVDRHRIKNKIYLNSGMNFTNRSLPLLYFFKSRLENMGYHPTQKTKFSIFLRKEGEILRYSKEIGFKNSKHSNKMLEFFKQKYGEVPKWS